MRNAFIVSYDICDPTRWRKVYKAMVGWGDHIQYSVFVCNLSERDKARMMAKLDTLIHHKEDQVLVIDLGPWAGRGKRAVAALGQPYAPRERTALVV